MKIRVSKTRPGDLETDVLLLPLFDDAEGVDILESALLEKEIRSLIKSEKFRARPGQTYLIRTLGNIKPESIVLVGLGSRKDVTKETFRRAGGQAGHTLKGLSVKEVSLYWDGLKEPEAFVEGLLLSSYSYTEFKRPEGKLPERLTLAGKNTSAIERKALEIQKIVEAVFFARDIINRPSNELGPQELADVALSLKSKRVKVTVYDRKKIESFGMHAFLAVSKGSAREPRLIVVEYNGGRKGPLALVGKSITFDSGGLSLKPSDAMEKMKYDMSGGAAVLGAIKAADALELPVRIIGILPATDNMPGGSATKPGDVVRAITGKTIEVLNTDAEGRLALADAIGFVRKKYKTEAIIDIATLTGACVIALGPEAAALMSNNDRLAELLLESSFETGERLWRMPLYDDYGEYLKSDIADLKNIGGRAGGLITAGYFLKEFAGDTPWAHIDIASVAWSEKDRFYYSKGPTAFGVRTFVDFLKNYRRP